MARRPAILCVLAFLAGVPSAAAEENPDVLVLQGEELAGQKRFEEAIDRFRQAEAQRPLAKQRCLIAAAFRRLERWGQAELWADRCRAAVAEGQPEPAWASVLYEDVRQGLARARGARVTIIVEPADADVRVVSAFGPDEVFKARPVFLPYGEHLVAAMAPGYRGGSATVRINKPDPREVRIVLDRELPLQPLPNLEPTKPTSRGAWPWVLFGVGGASLATGAIFHSLALGTKSDAEASPAAYDRLIDTFYQERAVAIGGYAVGAVAVGVGVFLLLTGNDAPVTVSGSIEPGGGMVWVGWSR